MSRVAHLGALEAELSGFPGTASVWCGPVGGPAAYARAAEVTHHAASTTKVSVLVALHRAAEDGSVDLDSAVPGAPRFGCAPDYDNDPAVCGPGVGRRAVSGAPGGSRCW